jgi:hypothetical protein
VLSRRHSIDSAGVDLCFAGLARVLRDHLEAAPSKIRVFPDLTIRLPRKVA